MTRQVTFSCKQCGSCCRWPGYVYLEEQDIPRLASALDLSEAEFIQACTRLSPNRRGLCLQTAEEGPCIFLRGNRCLHYNARPRQCRDYPDRWHVPEGCPGYELVNNEYINERNDEEVDSGSS